jgi:sialate O-acetylesterase
MIAPFFDGFAIRGAIWYQGEGNSSSVTADSDGSYTAHFNGVRNTFRDAFDDDELPVFIIQIPPRVGNPFYFRALQYELAKSDNNTYLVSSLYASSTYSSNELKYTNPGESMVHYERKSPVGLALADSVLEHVYGMADRSAPEILSVQKRDGAIVITFDTELIVDMGSEMLGFEIAGADKEWVSATATYRDKTVTLSAEGVSAPEYVRYGSGKSILVFEDGTEIIHNKENATFAYDEANGIVTITVGEKIYTIDISDPAVIGGRMPCNVVATNGTALPVFLAIAI